MVNGRACCKQSQVSLCIYEIIDVFKREEASTKVKMQMLEAGAQQVPRRRWVRQKERQFQNLFARFNSGAMSYNMNDYLDITQDFVIRLYICTFVTLLMFPWHRHVDV